MTRTYLDFSNNKLLTALYGDHDQHLKMIEEHLQVAIASRGNKVAIEGEEENVQQAIRALNGLYQRLEKGLDVGASEVDAALRFSNKKDVRNMESFADKSGTIVTPKKHITPRSPRQAHYIQQVMNNDLTFCVGPAGTGKTYMAVAMAVSAMVSGKVDRIILSRPAVEAGEKLGFLPGDLKEKVDPYMRPLYDSLHDMLLGDQVIKKLEAQEIEIAPLAFMRGRTLSNAFVILDEAQNTSSIQMKMFLTRLGENSTMVVCGDLTQVDLPTGVRSGLRDALDVLGDVKGVGSVMFDEQDVVRHVLVTRIVEAYRKIDLEKEKRYGQKKDGATS